MSEPTSAELSALAEEARRHLTENCARLDAALVPFAGGRPKAAWGLLEATQEFGADHVIAQLSKAPGDYGFDRLSPDAMAHVQGLLTAALSAYDSLDLAVAAREAKLIVQDPNRPHVMVHEGRDFTFDVAKREWRYLDQPDVTYVMALDRIPNRLALA